MVSRKADSSTARQTKGGQSKHNEKKLIAEAVENALSLLKKIRKAKTVNTS